MIELEEGGAAAARPGAAKPPPALVRWTEALSALCGRLTSLLAVALAAGFIGCLLLQVISRYVFNAPLSWSDEAAIFLFAWMIMLVASLGVRERFHVRLTFFLTRLPRRLQDALNFLFLVAITAFGGVLVVEGMDLVGLVWGDTSPAIQYPAEALYLATPISGCLIVVHGIAALLKDATGGTR
ncbi:MAG: TRAP transporter small permease [Alphaproteobacteria bacterium]